MPRVNANKLSIFYSESGSGFPIVFTHGGGGDHSQWDPQMGELSKKYRVVIWDRRNCGQTEPKGAPESADLWVADLRALMDALRNRQAYIGGTSYGGLLTLEFIYRYPKMAKGGIIVSATGEGYTPSGEYRVAFPSRMADLPNIKVPCLVVQGKNDTYFPPAVGEALARGLANAKLALIDAGHGVNQEKPKEFNKAVLDFLARVDARA